MMSTQEVQCRMVLVVNSFRSFVLNVFCFVLVLADLAYDAEAIFHLP